MVVDGVLIPNEMRDLPMPKLRRYAAKRVLGDGVYLADVLTLARSPGAWAVTLKQKRAVK